MELGILAVLGIAILFGGSQASAAIFSYDATLSGPSESSPNASPGAGNAHVIINDIAETMEVQVSFSGLTSFTTASHIHCCTPSPDTGTALVATMVPTFSLFPLGGDKRHIRPNVYYNQCVDL
jgi:hypothetical protein